MASSRRRRISALDVARALDEHGFADVVEAILGIPRQRAAADYLQASAVTGPDWTVRSAANDPNGYAGPETGYVLDGERWQTLQSPPHVIDPRTLEAEKEGPEAVAELHVASVADRPDEVVIVVGPAFGATIRRTINGLRRADVLRALCEGVREGWAEPRLLRVRRFPDVAFIGHEGAKLSGSRVAVDLQSKGTAVIHRADLEPLDNLELFGMSPLSSLDSYRAIGRNAAGYALGRKVGPVPTMLDNLARAKLIVKTTLLHAWETAAVVPGSPPSISCDPVARYAGGIVSAGQGTPPTPQFLGEWPSTITQVCSRRLSLVARQRASVSSAISLRLVSSFTRKSNSLTSIRGTAPLFLAGASR